jgi:hypothetical protein
MLNPAKDFILELAVKQWFNQTQKRYGIMTRIQIDSQARRIEIDLELKGESSPLHVDIKEYQITSGAGGETYVELGEIETSREWINAVIADYFKPEKRRFKVPGAVKLVL